MTSFRIVQPVAVSALMSLLAVPAAAADRQASEVLPPTTVIFVEIPQPQNLLGALYDPKLVARIESIEQVRAAMEKKPYLDFKAAVAVIESQMGMPWRKIVGQATSGGLFFAVDAPTKSAVILAHASDKSIHRKLLETLTNLATLDAKNKGKPDPIKTTDYHGIKIYKADKARVAVVEDWLVITNKEDLGKQVIDRFVAKSDKSFAGDAQFAKAHGSVNGSTTAWAYVNTAAFRDAGLAKKLLGGKSENPLAELLVGGILNALNHTPYVTLRLDSSDRLVRVAASAPYDHKWGDGLRDFYFGPEGKGTAPPQLFVKNTILTASSYRNASEMWLKAGDLFDEQMNEEFTKADAALTTLFGGHDFGEDILGAIKPETQLVVARQQFAAEQAAPAIQLPAFGLVAELKDPEKMQPELRRTFQSLIGFANIAGAMNGQPQLDLDMEKLQTTQFVTSSYLPDPTAKDSKGVKINYNFSPSIAFAGNRFVIASTKALAHELATANATSRPAVDADRVVNSDVVIQFDTLREILKDNRGQLVAQNMLKEGHSKEEAERDIGILLELIGWFDHLRLSLDTTHSELRASLDLAMKPAD